MKKKIKEIQMRLAPALMAATMALGFVTACNEGSEVGNSLVSDEISIVVDSSFTVSAHSVVSDAVLSRTVMQILGVIDVPEFGYMRSDIVTQFMPANTLDTTNVTVADIDSLKLVMLVNEGSFTGDSLALMGLEVYPLVRQLETPIYSNFNPEGYYDTTPIGSTSYNMSYAFETMTTNGNYFTVSVDLPVELGRSFFNEYKTNPATFSSPGAFARFFPGLYIRSSYGSGRITRIGSTTMQMYYHRNYVNDQGNDTTVYDVGSYFAVTPEIITNNDITVQLSDGIRQRTAQGQSLLVAPTGLEVEMTFPAEDIIASYRRGTADGIGVINNLTMRIPVETITNEYNIGVPTDVLLVLKKDRDAFFRDNKLPDSMTSFTATATAMSDGTTAYVFDSLRDYLINLMAKDEVTPDDYTFVLVPITVTTETNSDYYGNYTSTVTGIVPYVSAPQMGRIMTENIKINFVYSKQTTNF